MFKKKIVKFFTKTLVGRVADKVVLGGAINSTNTKTSRTNEGQADTKEIVLEILTSTIPVLLLLSLIFGWLDIKEIKEAAKVLLPFSPF